MASGEAKLVRRGDILRPSPYISILFQLFHSVCVPQSVQRVLRTVRSWRDIRDHSCLAIPDEGIFEHLGQLRPSERGMLLVEIERTYAFLQGQKGLVNLRSVNLRLFICMHCVSTALTACQINKTDLTVQSAVVLEHHLHDSMRA